MLIIIFKDGDAIESVLLKLLLLLFTWLSDPICSLQPVCVFVFDSINIMYFLYKLINDVACFAFKTHY